MNTLFKPTLLGLALAFICAANIAGTSAFAQEQEEVMKIKHKVVEIEKTNNTPMKIEIEENGEVQIVEITEAELMDEDLLDSKLRNLDEETRATVLKVIKMDHSQAGHGVAFIEKKDASFIVDDINIDDDMTQTTEIVIVNDGENVNFKGIIKGHHKAIIRLIEKGDFTREELTEIQKALDAKF